MAKCKGRKRRAGGESQSQSVQSVSSGDERVVQKEGGKGRVG